MKYLGRKIYHLLGGLFLVSVFYILGRDKALVFYGALFLFVLIIDLVRLSVPAVNRFMYEHFGSFIRQNEEHKLTGTPTYVLGIGLSFLFYSAEVATAAICFLAFGDVSATTIGERYGKTKIGPKSLEGTAAFITAALGAGFLLNLVGIHLPPAVIITGGIVAAGVELLPLPVNDNLIIPLISGLVMQVLSRNI